MWQGAAAANRAQGGISVFDIRRREFITLLGGAAGAWPLAARAQQSAKPVIGFMSGRSLADSSYLADAFRQGLRESGYVEGESISIEYRWADGDYDRLPGIVSDLLQHQVLVLVAVGGDSSAVAAKKATSTVPIVFGMGGDPIKAGLVTSFNRPGGNATGFTLLTNQMEPKRIGLLHELVPGESLLGALINPHFTPAVQQLDDIQNATRSIKLNLFVARADSDAELETAFATLAAQRVGAVLVAAAPFFDTRRERIITLAAQHRIPTMYQFREYAAAGGLISYGPSIADSYKQAGVYAGRILRGAKPGDLPVVQPTKFELVINSKTASALGFAIPNSMQLLADEVIE
jgi:putative tryptophan/tyrosine transport system substrate-binding protein